MSGRVGVIGTGYLGACQAVCLAELGHDVLATDRDPGLVADLAAGRVRMHEPGLEPLLRRHLATGRLRFTTSMAELAAAADVHFVCVGTPQRPTGLAADTSQVFAAVETLAPLVRAPTLVVGKSTVPPGTAYQLGLRCRDLAPVGIPVEVAWNPEFLREGHAVADTLYPDRLVLGVASAGAEHRLREVYGGLPAGVPVVVTDLVTAELVKVAANSFLATKISFANAMADLCERTGADVRTLTAAVGHDHRIGHGAFASGLGFGGGCLPKDLHALIAWAGALGAGDVVALLSAVDLLNVHRRRHVVELAVEMCGGQVRGRRLAVLGAAFKPGTDDVRDSPALAVAEELALHGALVTVHDPQANGRAAAAHPELSFTVDLVTALAGAELVLHLTDWPEYARLEPAAVRSFVARPRLIDGRNSLDAARWSAAGWSYRGLGRSQQRNGTPLRRPTNPPVTHNQ